MTRRSLAAKIASVDSGGWTAVASAPTLDRDGEVIAGGALWWSSVDVPVHIDHSLKVESMVGRAVPRYQAGKLIIDGTFASSPLAQSVRQLVVDRVLTTMSVVFIDAERKLVDQVPTITRGELVAVDFVSVPSNRDALVLSVRSLQNRTPGQARLMAFKAGITALEADLASLPAPPNHSLYRQLAELERYLDDRRR